MSGARLAVTALVLIGIVCGAGAVGVRGRLSLGREEGTPTKTSPGSTERLEEYERRYNYLLEEYNKLEGTSEAMAPTGAENTDIVKEMGTVRESLLRDAGLTKVQKLARYGYRFASIIAAAKQEGSDEDIGYCALDTAGMLGKSFSELDTAREANFKFVQMNVELREDLDKYAARLREAAAEDWDYQFVDSEMLKGLFIEYVTRTTDSRLEQLVAQIIINRLARPEDRLVWFFAMASEVPEFCEERQVENMASADLHAIRSASECGDGSTSCIAEATGHVLNRAEEVIMSLSSEVRARRSQERISSSYAERCWSWSEVGVMFNTDRVEATINKVDLANLKPYAVMSRLEELLVLKGESEVAWSTMFYRGEIDVILVATRAMFVQSLTCEMAMVTKKRSAESVLPHFNYHGAGSVMTDESLADLCHDMDIVKSRLRAMIHLAVILIDASGGSESQYYDAELLMLRILAEYAGLRGEDWMAVIDSHRDELCYRQVTLGFAGHSQRHGNDVWKDEIASLYDISVGVETICEQADLECDLDAVRLPEPCRAINIDLNVKSKSKTLQEWNDEFAAKLKEIEKKRSSWQHFLLKRSLNLRGDVPSPAGNAAVIPSVLTKFGAGRVPDQTFRNIDKCIVHDQIMRGFESDDDRRISRSYNEREVPMMSTPYIIAHLANTIRTKWQTHRLQDLKSFEHFIFDDISNSNIFMNGLGTNRDGRRGRKTTTNIGVSLEFFGDCREHANAMTSMFAYWQHRQVHQIIRDHFIRGRAAEDEWSGKTAYYASDEEDESLLRQPEDITADDMDFFTQRAYNLAVNRKSEDQTRRESIYRQAQDRVMNRQLNEKFVEGIDEQTMLRRVSDTLHSDVREIHGEFYIPGVVSQMYDVKHTPEGHGVLRKVKFNNGIPELTDYEKDPWWRKNFWVCDDADGRKKVFVQTKENDRVFSEEEQRTCVLYVLAEEHTFTILVHRNNRVTKYPTYLWDNIDTMSFEYADSFYSHVHDTMKVKNAFDTAGLEGRMKTAVEMMDGFEDPSEGRDKLAHEKSPMSLGYTGDNHILPFCKDPSDCGPKEGFSVRNLFQANEEQFLDEDSKELVSMPVYWRPTDFSGKVYSQADNEFEGYRPMDIGLEVADFKPTFSLADQQKMREYQAHLLFWYCSSRVGTEEECFTSKDSDPQLKSLFGGARAAPAAEPAVDGGAGAADED